MPAWTASLGTPLDGFAREGPLVAPPAALHILSMSHRLLPAPLFASVPSSSPGALWRHMMQQCGKPHPPIPSCRLSYALQSLCLASPARCPARVSLPVRSPWSASFPPRTPLPTHTRRLCSPASPVLCGCPTPRRRACRTLRLLPSPTVPPAIRAGVCGVSRFSRMEFPYMLRVFDSAGPKDSSRYRCPSCCLPHT